MYFLNRIGTTQAANYQGAGTNYPVITPTGKMYAFFIDFPSNDPSYSYSTDYGMTWSAPVSFKACTCVNMAVWYDRWSGIDADIVHVVYTDSGVDDTFYRTLDISNNTLGTERTVFLGASTAGGGALSITRARGGNIMVATCIDAGAEYDTRKSIDAGVNWTSPAEVFEAATTDQLILLPGWNADSQDIQCIFWDASADEISVKRYDDSADTWTETSIATTMADVVASTTTYPHFAASVDLENSQNVLIAWSAVDLLNADLRCWTINDTTITEKTAIITDSTDDQSFAALSINGSTWTAYYMGVTGGADTHATALSIRYKQSTNGGTTWGSELTFSNGLTFNTGFIFAPLIYFKNLFMVLGNATHIAGVSRYISPRANCVLGV